MDLLAEFTMKIPVWAILVFVLALGLQIREFKTKYDRSCGFCNHCLMRKQYEARQMEQKKSRKSR